MNKANVLPHQALAHLPPGHSNAVQRPSIDEMDNPATGGKERAGNPDDA